MRLPDLIRPGRPASIPATIAAALLMPAFLLVSALVTARPALAQTTLKFSFDGRLEGPAALFIVPQDKGYFQHEGLDVVIEEAATALEPITRAAGFWSR